MAHALLSRLGIEHPLIQAPMSGSTTPHMVAEVSGAGALGSLGAGYLEPQALLDQAAAVRARCDRPFGINLFVLPETFTVDEERLAFAREQLDALMQREGLSIRTVVPSRWAPSFGDQLAALREARPAVASFAFGVLEPAQVRELQRLGVAVMGTATTVDEALAWEAVGADAVCLQGAEAGGHRGGFLHDPAATMIGLFALIPLAARAVKIPLVAAGGIMDGRGMRAAELLGAAASQLGTAFLGCPECAAAEGWKQDLGRAGEYEVGTIQSFSGRAARGLINTWVKALEPVADRLPGYPVLNALTSPLRKAAVAAGRADLTNEWCGQGASRVRPMPAAALVRTLVAERAAALDGPA